MAVSNTKSAGLILILILLIVALLGTLFWQKSKPNTPSKEQKVLLRKNADESSMFKTDKYQAIFLDSGQVYFGKLSKMDEKYLTLTDIYYLHSNTIPLVELFYGTNAKDIALIKLGCEMHGPEDRMVINRDKIDFWENLKDGGPVVKAIKNYQKANPKGQICPSAESPNDIEINPAKQI